MTPEEEKAHYASLARKARKLRQLGKPQRVLPHEYEAAMRILFKAHATGMSMTQMADQFGSVKSTIQHLMVGKRKTMKRETYEGIMRLQPELPKRTGGTRRGGAKVDPTGTTRRLQALCAMGWTCLTAAPYIGVDARNLSNIMCGKVVYVYAVTRNEIADVYDKLQYMDPLANGTTSVGMQRSKVRSQRLGYAPPWAWDEDTIDNPKASPEWTGACGTPEGYQIHVRETIFEKNPMPPCARCRAAVEVRPPGVPRRYHLNRERLTEAIRDNKRSTVRALADRVLPDSTNARDTLYRWCDGSRLPRSIAVVERLAAELDIPLDELLDQEAMDQEAGEAAAIGNGHFNPYVLRAAMELSGTSQHKLSLIPDAAATQNTISKWLRGESRPSDPSKVDPIAKFFGVKTEVFYT